MEPFTGILEKSTITMVFVRNFNLLLENVSEVCLESMHCKLKLFKDLIQNLFFRLKKLREGDPDVMYVFTGGIFNKKLANDFHTSDLWADALNELDPIIVIPTYHELKHGIKYFKNTFDKLNTKAILTNGNYYSDATNKTLVLFPKHRIKKIRGKNILFLGVLCYPKIKSKLTKYLLLDPVVESIK